MLEDRGKLGKLKLLMFRFVGCFLLNFLCDVWPKVGLYMHGSTIFLNHAPNDLDAASELSLWLLHGFFKTSAGHGERISLPLLTGLKSPLIPTRRSQKSLDFWEFSSCSFQFSAVVPGACSEVLYLFLTFSSRLFHGVWTNFQLISASQESQFILGRLEVSVYPRNPKQSLGQPWGHDESRMTWGDFFLQRLEAMDMTMLSLDRFQNFQHDDWRWLIIDERFPVFGVSKLFEDMPLHTCSFRNQAIGRWSITRFQAETGCIGGLTLHWDGSICRFGDSFFWKS